MASACTSSQKAQTNAPTNARKGATDKTVCSSNERCYLQKKKPANPLSVSIRPPARNSDNVRQRVRSAKLIKIRSLQSQLNDANFHLMELAQENRALQTMQRRQDKALKGYEDVNADLPRLLKSHEEENRTLVEKNRTMKRQVRELTEVVRARDDELLAAKDQLKHLTALAKDKGLEEREQLRVALNEAKDLIKSYETEISILNRKLMLEAKNCRQKLSAEASKHRRCQQELAQAIGELDRQNESKGRLLRKRFESPPGPRQSSSTLSSSTSKETIDAEVTRLEPIKKRTGSDTQTSLTSPAEKIKARLSTTEGRPHKIEDFNEILDKLTAEEEFVKKSFLGGLRTNKIRSTKLETLVQNRNGAKNSAPSMRKAMRPDHIEADDLLVQEEPEAPKLAVLSARTARSLGTAETNGNARLNGDESLSDTEEVVSHHLKSLKESEREFERVQEEIKEIEKIEAEISRKKVQGLVLADDDYDLVNQIWSEEYSFRKSQRGKSANGDSNDADDKKDPVVVLENKKKLLAALRDIDNGKSLDAGDLPLENSGGDADKKSRLMKELFG